MSLIDFREFEPFQDVLLQELPFLGKSEEAAHRERLASPGASCSALIDAE